MITQSILCCWFVLLVCCAGFSTVSWRRSCDQHGFFSSLKNPQKYTDTGPTVLYNDVRKTPNKRDKNIEKLLDAIDHSRVSSEPQIALADDPELPMVETIVRAADKRKATSVSVFRVYALTEVTTFMVLIEGNSKPQNQAISLAIQVQSMSAPAPYSLCLCWNYLIILLLSSSYLTGRCGG